MTNTIKTPFETRLEKLEADIAVLKSLTSAQLQNDLEDIKEAFEHTDDSVSNMRTVITHITDDVTALKQTIK